MAFMLRPIAQAREDMLAMADELAASGRAAQIVLASTASENGGPGADAIYCGPGADKAFSILMPLKRKRAGALTLR